MANYSIRDLEQLTGIKAHTIRIWEKRYGLIEPERTATNIRAYCDDELRKLLNVAILNKNGLKISKIANLSSKEIIQNINKLTEQSTETGSYLENLAIAMIDLDEAKFEKILTRAIIQMGFEETIVQIVNPFFVRIGFMWQTGSINPAQEHFISNLIRQKMLVAIDSQITGESSSAKKFTLFLPEGEMHELVLLFANYMLRKRGHKVLYLGQNVPLNDLEEIERIRPSDYMFTSLINSMTHNDGVSYLTKLSELFPDKTIYVTGEKAKKHSDRFNNGLKFIKEPTDFIAELNTIASFNN